ncbi:MAG: PIN domain-containing protein [Euryarchaeota archaeon]|nr:PIN domain-containing protein [Euryarchaeota archaeon]
MVVLDTDFVIDLTRGVEPAAELLRTLAEGYEPLAVSSVTVMQLHHGVARARRPAAEMARVDRALRGAATYAFTHDIAAIAGRLEGDLEEAGTPIGLSDVMIAATALHHGEPIVTRNTRHFRLVSGLHLLDY